jgi:hypothetical protein
MYSLSVVVVVVVMVVVIVDDDDAALMSLGGLCEHLLKFQLSI